LSDFRPCSPDGNPGQGIDFVPAFHTGYKHIRGGIALRMADRDGEYNGVNLPA
jgi:hypothetical protein